MSKKKPGLRKVKKKNTPILLGAGLKKGVPPPPPVLQSEGVAKTATYAASHG